MSSPLSQLDVTRLMQEPSALVRAEIALKLAREMERPSLNESELSLVHEIVHLMAKDVEIHVRKTLAHCLRNSKRLPREIAIKLANDIDQIALPILEYSSVLTDEDLIEILQTNSEGKNHAVARRPYLSELVSENIINNASEAVVTTLMKNNTAQISTQGMTSAIDRFGDSDVVKEAMVMRPVLPLIVAEKLATCVSERLKEYLVVNHELSPTITTDLILQGRERAVLSMSSGSTDYEIEKMIRQMEQNGRLTPSILMRALCMGDLRFFEISLAVLAHVPIMNASILVHDAGRIGLKTLYEKSGMPMHLFPVVKIALEVIQETEMGMSSYGREKYRARVIERILTQSTELEPDDINYLLTKLGDIMTVTVSH